ncbi:GNAT family N-acetyltransferase [Planosporangium mesophilum]|uniref:N-acetyltransferase n=1 Tax=Planosporangium mesophilum TaxID=689768 RepID=A0A8J3TGY3_9ACTN|nr:GNAT family N-acetyltransferase [Planosporangium mesophilum]NJC86610.1 GNAT family N-acetyltransferase [Planosporangium mesophilum]GII25396.1 N-acetyltransferase [Planosporangium mesophilum]
MVEVRQASPEDAPELVRLRAVMLASLTGEEPVDGPWREAALRTLRGALAEPDGTLVAFVVDSARRPGRLAACVLGAVECRLASPENPTGVTGHVFSVATDPDERRRGYSRACMERLIDWYRRRGITTVDLRASREGEPLYRSLGFARTADPAMRLKLGALDGAPAGPVNR